MSVLYRFPPSALAAADQTFLQQEGKVFAKLKIESRAGKRLVFLTEHTLLMVLKGTKLLHFADHTCHAGPDQLLLLKKGIYVMAEYLEPGLDFEALLLFLPVQLLRSLASQLGRAGEPSCQPYLLFQGDGATDLFRQSLRRLFEQPPPELAELMALKQREILLLLLASGHRAEIGHFLYEATAGTAADLEFTVRQYLYQPITLAELAGLCNRSLASFKRDFTNRYGMPPRQWINRERLGQAELLLRNTDQGVAEIALACGYENSSYFIRLFRSVYGVTPAVYRSKTAII